MALHETWDHIHGGEDPMHPGPLQGISDARREQEAVPRFTPEHVMAAIHTIPQEVTAENLSQVYRNFIKELIPDNEVFEVDEDGLATNVWGEQETPEQRDERIANDPNVGIILGAMRELKETVGTYNMKKEVQEAVANAQAALDTPQPKEYGFCCAPAEMVSWMDNPRKYTSIFFVPAPEWNRTNEDERNSRVIIGHCKIDNDLTFILGKPKGEAFQALEQLADNLEKMTKNAQEQARALRAARFAPLPPSVQGVMQGEDIKIEDMSNWVRANVDAAKSNSGYIDLKAFVRQQTGDTSLVSTNKIRYIKIVRERTGLGLKDAKAIVDAWFAPARGPGMDRP